jgi:circadian clock protein KaiB
MDQHTFTLFVAGGTELAGRAVANFERLVRHRLGEDCRLTVVDVLKEPRRAREHRVLATPLLIREQPPPTLRILGDLSQEEKILTQLGLTDTESNSDFVTD